ncbi:hypothetical protein GV827_11210 [Sulfitobacter sp. JBTF-M27]|uniref:Antitoxin n=1 Tax=Sulfitobacter sediminilitoris TaxID=2698830 RepID=A0A6P0CCA0_9RHOB|nr:hypothetical protein [Sulfitobacter sediminilitoris]NEK22970.1 hypothetical protein [Sulfitobacter sediminilitoris]
MVERIVMTVEEAQAGFERLVDAVLRGVEVVIVREDGFRVELVAVDPGEIG